jgi:hypothetical protein
VTTVAGAPARPDTSDAALQRVTDALAANAERYDRAAGGPLTRILRSCVGHQAKSRASAYSSRSGCSATISS